MVLGNVGVNEYIDPPFKMSKQLSGRDIYAWKPGAKKLSDEERGLIHAVLLVGAEKVQNKAFVYFIDSVDPSDPNNPSTQKIYKRSFDHFKLNLCNLGGYYSTDTSCDYAYYGNFKK